MDELNEYFSVAPASSINSICIFLFVGSLFSVEFSSLIFAFKELMFVVVLLSIVLFFCSLDRRVVAVGYNVYSGWRVYFSSHSECAVILSHSVVTRYVSIVYLKGGKKTYCVIFLGGFFEPFFYRRLRYLIKVH
jgi:hypothetical protein